MATRTYLPTLQAVARQLCLYITRYNLQIREALPSDKHALLDAVMVACEALTLALEAEIPKGD